MTENGGQWRVESARSRATQDGYSALDVAELVGPGGIRKSIRMPVDEGGISVRAVPLVRPPGLGAFDVCPICLDPGPDSREHVPQGDLGGKVMTLTCSTCNNTLGSRVEPALLDYVDNAYTRFAATSDRLPGKRQLGRVLLRETSAGEPVWLVSSGPKFAPVMRELMQPGSAFMSVQQPPSRLRLRLAALKHAYLAACLCLQGIPESPQAREIRRVLVAVRDAPLSTVPEGAAEIVADLNVQRTGLPSNGVPISLDVLLSEAEETVAVGLHLGGTLFVSWPLEPQFLRMCLETAGIEFTAEDGGLTVELPL